jgi:hypothetical protein
MWNDRLTSRRLRRKLACLLAAAPVLLPSAGLGAAANKARLSSEWASTPVVVDGVGTEWPSLHSLGKDVRLSIAVRNDDQRIYIALITSDAFTAMQVMNAGLEVWLDVEGGSKKRFGIEYPVPHQMDRPQEGDGGSGQGRPQRPHGGEGGRGAASSGEQAPDPEDGWRRMLSDPRLDEAALLGRNKEDRRPITLDRQVDVLAKLGRSADGILVYELAVPLSAANALPDWAGTKPGSVIGIGVETPERAVHEGPDGRGGPGGRGGGMGGRGGRMRGSEGGRGGWGGTGPGEEPKTLKAWTTVQLATRQ